MTSIRIQHWYRKYRASSKHAQWCESAAAQDVLSAMETELAQRLAATDEVMLIRAVNLKFTVDTSAYSQAEIANGMGRAMAKAVTETIDRNDRETIRRFPNRVEYLVAFLKAHLGGQPSNQWFFDNFNKKFSKLGNPEPSTSRRISDDTQAGDVTSGDVSGELDKLWLDVIDDWPEIAGRLAQLGLLGSALRRTSVEVRERLWLAGVRGFDLRRDPELERPIFAAALALVQSYAMFEFDSSKVSAAYDAFKHRLSVRTDWNDKTHLSEAVSSAFQFLVQHLSGSEPISTRINGWNAAIDAAVSKMDWLDIDWLVQRLKVWLSNAPKQSEATASPPNLTYRQRAWIDAWKTVSTRFYAEWDQCEPVSAQNRLLAFGLLTEVCPAWSREPALAVFVEQLLSTSNHNSTGTTSNKTSSDASALCPQVKRIKQGKRSHNRDDKAATESTRVMTSEVNIRQEARPQGWSDFAGVFLLLRSISDLRLTSIARNCHFPDDSESTAAKFMLDLALSWNSDQLFSTQLLNEDCGLMAIANLVAPVTWCELCDRPLSTNRTAIESFQCRLAKTLIHQGVWTQTTQLQVCTQRTPSGKYCLLGGDGTSRVLPFTGVTTDPLQAKAIIAGWAESLTEAAGGRVDVYVDSSTQSVFGDLGWPVACSTNCESPLRWNSSMPSSLDEPFNSNCAAAADVVLRHWSRWIKGNKDASSEYLLDKFIRRGGYVHTSDNRIVVALQRKPLDVVLQVSGAFEPFDYFVNKRIVKVVFQTSDLGSTS